MLLPAVRWYSLTAATENPSPSRAPALLRSPRAAAALPRCRAHCSLARPNPRAQHGITNYVIGALDVDLETYLKDIAPQLGVRIAILSLNSGLTTGDYGWNTPAFKRMAKFKFLPVQAGLPPPRTSFVLFARTYVPNHPLILTAKSTLTYHRCTYRPPRGICFPSPEAQCFGRNCWILPHRSLIMRGYFRLAQRLLTAGVDVTVCDTDTVRARAPSALHNHTSCGVACAVTHPCRVPSYHNAAATMSTAQSGSPTGAERH